MSEKEKPAMVKYKPTKMGKISLCLTFSFAVFCIDKLRFNKINNPDMISKMDKQNIIYLILGLVIGIIYGKIL